MEASQPDVRAASRDTVQVHPRGKQTENSLPHGFSLFLGYL